MTTNQSHLEKLIQELCPNGVEFKSLSEVVNILDNQRKPISKANRRSGKYPYYWANGIQDYVDNYIFDGTFLLLGEDGSVINKDGSPVLNWAIGKIWVNNHAHILSEKSGEALLRYVFFALSVLDVTKVVKGNIPKITQTDLKNFQIPLPPLPIQQEIVKILDTFTDLEAELEAELEARIKQYAYYQKKLLSFPSEEDEVRWSNLGEVGEFTYGFTDKAKDEGNVRFIRITDINENGKLRQDEKKFLNLNDNNKKYLLQKWDLLVARTGATYGKTMLFDGNEQAIYASFLIKIDLDNSTILPLYYWHFSQSSHYWDQANKLVGWGAQPQFNANVLKLINIPIPSIKIQQEIIKTLNKFDALANDLSIGLPAEIEARKKQYEYYRDKLLTFSSDSQAKRERERERERERVGWKTLGEIMTKTKGTKITAEQMKKLHKNNAPVRIFAWWKTFADVDFSDIPEKDIQHEVSIIVKSRWIIEFEYYAKPFSHKAEFWAYHPINKNIVDIKFVWYYLRANQSHFQDIGSQMSKMPQISAKDTDTFSIPIPPLSKQQEIVAILDQFDTLVNDISIGLPAEIQARRKQYEYYREKLLTFKPLEK